MTVSVGDFLKVVATLVWLDGNIAQNVFAVAITGTGGPYDNEDILDDALDWVEDMYAELVAHLSDEIDGSQIQVYKYDPVDDDFDEVGTTAWVFNPTGVDDQMPRGVAGLLTTQTVDPDVQGKKYVPGLTEAHLNDGLLSATMVTKLAAFGVVWLAPFVGATSGADFDPGVWSPTNRTIYDASGSFTIPTIPAYQRRRKRGVGV